MNGELINGLRPTSLRYPNGRLVHYTYGSTDSTSDVLNRLGAINDDDSGSPGDVLASYTYLGLGSVVTQDYEEPEVKLDLFGGTSGVYAGLDRFDRVVDHRWYDYGSSVDVDRFKYGYDRASNRVWKENTVSKSQTTPVYLDEFYIYDGLHRLQNFDRGELNGTNTGITGTPAKEEDWSLDPLGNWSNFVQKSGGATDLDQDREVNRVNEITDISESTGPSWITPAYDRNGNMVVVPKPADPTVGFTCTYDPWNRMVKVEEGLSTIAQYGYDTLKRRVTKTIDSTVRHFLYSSQWQCLEERIDSSAFPERQHVWGPQYVDQLILRDRDTSEPINGTLDERLYALQDANWNVTTLVDSSSTVIERCLYEPYGKITFMDGSFGSKATSNVDTSYTFTGRRLDSESGLYYYRNRYYDARLGQFVSRDPIAYEGSEWNLYEYVDARPTSQGDAAGMQAKPRTKEECCKQAWADPEIATTDGEKPPAGMVICCDGRKVACAKKRNIDEDDSREGLKIVLDCILAHEKVHFDHVEDCTPFDPCDPALSRPAPLEPDRLNFYECEAHAAQLQCLIDGVAKCKGDKKCIGYLKGAAFGVTEDLRTRKCSDYGITYPKDWRDKFPNK